MVCNPLRILADNIHTGAVEEEDPTEISCLRIATPTPLLTAYAQHAEARGMSPWEVRREGNGMAEAVFVLGV